MVRQAIRVALAFVQRQKRNYRVGMARSSAAKFLTNLTSQYSAIYTVGLGANTVQLGSLSSIGSAISALISTPVGWLVDRKGIKRYYLLAIALMAGSSLLYGIARDWRFLVVASLLVSVATRLTGTGCRVISADSVPEQRSRDGAERLWHRGLGRRIGLTADRRLFGHALWRHDRRGHSAPVLYPVPRLWPRVCDGGGATARAKAPTLCG